MAANLAEGRTTAPKNNSKDRRARLIALARDMVRREGMEGLNLRTLAEQDGTSTQAIYTLFGGKPGLVRALYEHWVQDLEQRLLTAAPTAEPEALLQQTAFIYRALAKTDRSLFLAGATQIAQDADVLGMMYRSPAFALFAGFVKANMDAGIYEANDQPLLTARTLWAGVHGAVTVEIQMGLDEQAGLTMLTELVALLMKGLRKS